MYDWSIGVPFVALAGQDAQPLPVPRRTIYGVACDINDQGEIAGSVRTAEKEGGFQYEYRRFQEISRQSTYRGNQGRLG